MVLNFIYRENKNFERCCLISQYSNNYAEISTFMVCDKKIAVATFPLNRVEYHNWYPIVNVMSKGMLKATFGTF